MTSPQTSAQGSDHDWSLRSANQEELRRLARELRVTVAVTVAASFIASALVLVFLEALGFRFALPLFLIAIVWFLAARIVSARRNRSSAPLEASLIVGTWMAREGLVDDEGRLTSKADELLASHRGFTPADEVHGSSVRGANGLADRDHMISLTAFVDARQRYFAASPWLEPFVGAETAIETSEVRSYLERQADRGPNYSKWAWLALAVLGLLFAAVLAFWIQEQAS